MSGYIVRRLGKMGLAGHAVDPSGRPESLRLLGERPCLDFSNTVDPRHGERPREYLKSYADLVAWARRAGVLGEEEAGALVRVAELRPREAGAVFERALALRGTIYDVFSTIAAGREPYEGDLAGLNEELARALAHARVVRKDGSLAFGWGWEERVFLDRPLWEVARSAAELLTSGKPGRVRECPGEDGCGWLFYDESKNGSRRWCSMEGCGNRAKARSYHARRKADDPKPPSRV